MNVYAENACTECDGRTPDFLGLIQQVEETGFGPEEVGIQSDADGVWHNVDLVVFDDQWHVVRHVGR